MMGISSGVIIKFIKFGLVGASGILVDFGVTVLCKEYLKIQKYVANSLGFTMAVVSNYTWNRLWTFQSEDPHIYTQFGKFLLVSVIGLVLNNLAIYLLNGKLKIHFYIAKALAIAVVMLWNFFANYWYTFGS